MHSQRDLLKFIKISLKNILSETEAESEANWIFEHLTNKSPRKSILDDVFISDFHYSEFNKILERRKTGEPLAYILSHAYFYGNKFKLNQECLIPRFDSEVLVERLLQHTVNSHKSSNALTITDLCCGSGCLGVSVANELCKLDYFTQITLQMVDISYAALQIAAENAVKILQNKVKIQPINTDILTQIPTIEKADILLYNPPYIASNDIPSLEKQVRDFEPNIALDGGIDGLVFYRRISDILSEMLKPGAIFGIEFGNTQRKNIEEIFSSFEGSFHTDLAGNDRCAIFHF